jgi:macrolide transport system ATP-binding/permease protein
LLGSIQGGHREDELSAEIEDHIRRQTEDNIRLGMSRDDARRAAMLKFGSVEPVKENYRDQRGIPQLETLLQDVTYALRAFAKRPSFVLTAVLSLGLGIGMNATVFTWFKAVYLNPLPGVVHARELVTISAAFHDGDGFSNSYQDYLYIRDHSRLFNGLFAHEMEMLALNDGKTAEITTGGIVSGNYFQVLGTHMALGRGFQPEEDEVLDRNPVIVLGYGLWQRRFGGAPNIIGRQLELNRVPFTVIGVTEPGFIGVYGGLRQEYFLPMHMARALDPDRRDRLSRGSWMQIMGRPKPGVPLAALQAEMPVLGAQIRAEYRKEQPDYRTHVYPLHKAQRGLHSSMFQMVKVLGVAVSLILLLACLNVANLLIARATDRSREIGIRLSLGAGRGRILRQLLTESLLLSLMGGVVGLLIAVWTHSAPQLLAPSGGGIELYLNSGIDWSVIAFLFAVCLLAAALFGILPAFETTRLNLVDTLKEGAASVTSGRRRNLWRRGLVVGQVAISLAALVAATLFGESLIKTMREDRGFKAENVLTASTDLFAGGLPESRGRVFYRSVTDQLQAMPQIESVAWTTFLPMSSFGGGNYRPVVIPGFVAPDGKPVRVTVDAITPGYLRTLRIPLASGREFEWSDDKNTAQVLIVNQKFVDDYFRGRDPIGASVVVGGVSRTVVGVHRDYIYRMPGNPEGPTIFLPIPQDYATRAIVVVRTKSDPALAAVPLRQAILGFDRNLPIARMMNMEESVGFQFVQLKAATAVLTMFGVLALILSAVGLYGVLATFVNQRRREFGVRSALGATPGDLRGLVLRESTRLTLIGAAVGLLMAVGLAQVLASMLSGLTVMNPVVYLTGAAVIAVMAFVSTVVPSRTAGRIDPVLGLRHE